MEGAGGEGAIEQGFWRQVVEQLSTALMVVDPAGRILAVNPAAERLLGRTARAMRGMDAHELLHRDADGSTLLRELCPLLQALAERVGRGPRSDHGGRDGPTARHPAVPGLARRHPAPAATLLLYTDGLIEIPGSDLDTGLGRLRRHALALATAPLDTLCDELLARMPPGSTDDVALLALRLPDS
ncbi:SpoIIE family protein phosphatase [Streptomyces sp. NPDC001604]|uniref:SpoIIE family protein phosphatase n=1 Tax=Streptomyces sp. NPDC001604 TaxID=3364593 RepID=UPI0036941587